MDADYQGGGYQAGVSDRRDAHSHLLCNSVTKQRYGLADGLFEG
jgi:hypothetical protein